MNRWVFYILGGACSLSGIGISQGISAPTDIGSPDVYLHVDLIRQELEELRAYMGRPKDSKPELVVSGAEPREVFFQVISLFQKSDRLCFEHTRERSVLDERQYAGSIRPKDVYRIVDKALKRIQLVKTKYQLDKGSRATARDPSKTPSDVFRSIVQANRQLNILLDQQVSPSDVYQQVTLAIGYAEKLLGLFPGVETMPTAPGYEPDKMPQDVYGSLLASYGTLRAIFISSGLEALELEGQGDSFITDVAPSDVYDNASLVVSELDYLHNQSGAPLPRKVYYPGRKFPSDVYQRTGILDAQLQQLQGLVGNNAGWLTSE